jgi:uncharacterized protein DUF4265
MNSKIVQRLVKVRFELDWRDWHGSQDETLWAAFVSTEHDCRQLRLENSPFHATGIAYCDIVKAKPTEDPILYEFEQVIARGGHSTYMLLVEEDKEESPKFHSCWHLLREKGCSYESAHINFSVGRRLLLSVDDVPPSADLYETYDVLKRGEADGVWMLQEGYAHLPSHRA